jgi:hypothetical protein
MMNPLSDPLALKAQLFRTRAARAHLWIVAVGFIRRRAIGGAAR